MPQYPSKASTGVAGAASNSYTYDGAGRIASWSDGSVSTAYGWDDAGNLVRQGAETATFNERNQLMSHDGTSYTYSPRGTMASRKDGLLATAIEYNAFDQLVADGGTNYEYDGLNRLVKAGGKHLAYVGTTLDIAQDGTRAYTYTPDGMMLGVGGVPGSLVSQGEPAGVGWTDLHTDLIGVVDPATGSLSGSRSYDPFGDVVRAAGVQPRLGYQHQFTDPGTGNVNMGARWYQPDAGTFASRDNAALDPRDIGNANRYAYAGANPLTQTDPEGYFWGRVWNGIKRAARVVVKVVKEVSGYNDLKGCLGGSWSSCGWFIAGLTPVGKIAKGLKYGAKALGKFGKGSRASGGFSRAASKARAYGGRVSSYGGKFKASYGRYSAKLGKYGHAASYAARGAFRSAGRGMAKGFARGGGAVAWSAEAAAAAARAAAEAARLAARRAMVQKRAVTPAAKPASTPSISPSVQAKIDAANNQPAIDLGTMGVGDDVLGAGGRAADEFVPTPEVPSFAGPSGGAGPGIPSAGPGASSAIDAYHATTSAGGAQGVLGGISKKYLSEESRFGKAFHVSSDADTTLAELAHHGAKATHGIRFKLNLSQAKVLDLADSSVAKSVGYFGGPISDATRKIGTDAARQGYNVIRFPSLRGRGMNYAILDDFDKILSPQMVSPAP